MAIGGAGSGIHVTGLTHDEQDYPDVTAEAQTEVVARLTARIRLLSGRLQLPPAFCPTTQHRGQGCSYTLDDAMMPPCGADDRAWLDPLAADVSPSASSWGFSAAG
jgi:hypothetical protein